MNPLKLLPNLIERLPWPKTRRRIFRLEVPAQEFELLTIKDFIQRVCDAAGCSSKESSSVKLAVDEACSNIVRHAYVGVTGGKIALEAGIGRKNLRIVITDFGKSFDFRNVEAPDLNHYVDIGKKGGLGIFLIRKIMYKVVYRSQAGRNELILYRRLSQAPPAAALAGVGKNRSSVSTKFTLGSVALIFLIILAVYFFLNFRNETFVLDQQRDKVESLTQTMAAQAGESVDRKDDLALDRLIQQIRQNDSDHVLDYIFVVNADNKFLAHSDLNRVFKEYHRPGIVRPVKSGGVKVFNIKTSKGPVSEFVAPIFFKGKWVGEVHAGMDRDAVNRLLGNVKWELAQMILGLSLIIIFGLYFLSLIVIRPFRKILEGINAVSAGDLTAKIDLDSKDE
ncbi:MAG: ATP-binding protein, partial [bacterium]